MRQHQRAALIGRGHRAFPGVPYPPRSALSLEGVIAEAFGNLFGNVDMLGREYQLDAAILDNLAGNGSRLEK